MNNYKEYVVASQSAILASRKYLRREQNSELVLGLFERNSLDHFPLVINSYHYIKVILCSFRLLKILVERRRASLHLADLEDLGSGVRIRS
jgi:hypothetical protein